MAVVSELGQKIVNFPAVVTHDNEVTAVMVGMMIACRKQCDCYLLDLAWQRDYSPTEHPTNLQTASLSHHQYSGRGR